MKILTIIGTRPEAIKMAPIIKAIKEKESFSHYLCSTSQHEHMLEQALNIFDLQPNIAVTPAKKPKTLAAKFSYILEKLDQIVLKENPDMIMVHGDTLSTLCGAMAAFYNRKDVIHIEAGLRTHNIYSPWPEEINRKMTSTVTKWHFCPTTRAKQNLIDEGYDSEQIHVVGNSVIDALLLTVKELNSNLDLKNKCEERFKFLNKEKKMILVTGHRRENFGEGLKNICLALKKISKEEDVQIIYPVHLNPEVQNKVNELLSNDENIHLIPPVDYIEFVFLMMKSYLILTDSGGVQEEAPSLGRPVLVMREETERPEAISAGVAKLVGADTENIFSEVTRLLNSEEEYLKIANIKNPFGEGNTSEAIVNILYKSIS